MGTSLVVQWLRLRVPNAGGPGPVHGRGTRSHMLHLRACMPQLKVLHDAMKTGITKWINIKKLKRSRTTPPTPHFLHLNVALHSTSFLWRNLGSSFRVKTSPGPTLKTKPRCRPLRGQGLHFAMRCGLHKWNQIRGTEPTTVRETKGALTTEQRCVFHTLPLLLYVRNWNSWYLKWQVQEDGACLA